ncbi:MAG: GyrI-like domain-containing protein [Aggregatilineales bacterium]
MKTTQPKIEEREEQPYMGIRTLTSMADMPDFIGQSLDEVFGWLSEQGITPAGAPILRLNVVNMEANMDIEVGVPVKESVTGTDRIKASVLPAGRYAFLIYTGVENGVAGNRVLIDWAKENGIEWDRWDDENGDAFRSRYEVLIDGPDDKPDPADWDNEVAIKIADD